MEHSPEHIHNREKELEELLMRLSALESEIASVHMMCSDIERTIDEINLASGDVQAVPERDTYEEQLRALRVKETELKEAKEELELQYAALKEQS